MSYTVIDHGSWDRYYPENPVVTPVGVASYSKRASDDLDWYTFARDPKTWTENSIKATVDVTPEGLVVGAVYRDPSMLFPQGGQHLIEILGVDPSVPDGGSEGVHTLFEKMVVDVAAGTFTPRASAIQAPDGPTLSDWRVALRLWGRIDEVTSRVTALKASSDPKQVMMGEIAMERLEYANSVQRTQLMALKDVFGFTAADVEESLWRAAQVAKGDLSGVWPLPAAA